MEHGIISYTKKMVQNMNETAVLGEILKELKGIRKETHEEMEKKFNDINMEMLRLSTRIEEVMGKIMQ